MRKLMAGLAAAGAVAVFSESAFSQDTPGVTKDTITIGSFGALTGPNYLFGKIVMNGVEAVFDKVNAEGGIHGRKLTLLREDDRCEPGAAIAAVKKLIHQDKVFAINGGGCSNAAIAAKEEIAQAGVPWLIFASVHDGLTNPVSPGIFTSALTASIEGQAQVEFALQQKAKNVAIVSMRDSWGRSRYEPLVEYMKKKGVSIVADEELAPDANDATPVVLRLKQKNVDAVILLLYPKPGAVFLRDAAKFAFKPLMIGQSAIADPAAFEEQVGVPGATASFYTISHIRHTPESPEIAAWREAVEKKFPGDRISTFSLLGIGSAQVLVAALKEAGPNLTREGFVKALGGMSAIQTDIFAAPINCKVADHRCNRAPAWLKKEPGGPIKIVAITPVD